MQVLEELRVLVTEPRYTLHWWFRELRHRWYLRGRWKINGRRSRYEAGSDICLAALQILREFEQDAHSLYFMGDHEQSGTVYDVRNLINKGERIDYHSGDLDEWIPWLKEVADTLPQLWD
jgi:hypothetical protein